MSKIADVVAAYPAQTGVDARWIAEAVEKLNECAGVCLACADACAAEQDHQMIAMSIKCMRMDQDCADICTAAARVLLRQTGYDGPTTFAIIEAARAALRACGDACAEMGDMEHCAICAQSCRQTEAFLGRLTEELRSPSRNAATYPTEPPSATTPAGARLASER